MEESYLASRRRWKKKLRTLRPEESTAAWSFRFIQSLDSALLTLSGASTLSQLAENIAVFEEEKPVSAEEKLVLFEIAKEISRGVPCTRCRYCLSHCPQNLDIPRLISIYNDEVFSEGGRITRLHLSALPADRQPASCVSCGECTKMCPQGISVPDILRDFVKRLG
ncbi:MAG TPA: 4Fe-4S dicluster domain-containing protein [Methanocorpusculum sp.]|nr:4Fe-4S dicluster domain-containing protein [Candidatus Methanocorpusculum equi]MCQ2358374.1 4Fe-4S dicluster domain-containing protein [Methanocorpusculum sp.]HJJ33311.1 4Fe-4S dicluster domain-containing protein [Methanocorpusculum sp.]HJJ44940.1 4Fe-4S dicluster domain-containing protein [Methanocorpusculum sp.]HJJ58906.1 4Fe-4S dicluster domain-containing protein [Methanocorpusculum sp.]